MRILIVEDERRLAEALGQIMAEQRYQADVVFDGADGLDYALTGQYDAIVLDPPAYGRGADGEKWILEEQIGEMLACCAQLLSPDAGAFLVLNLYSMGLSAMLARTAVRQAFGAPADEQYGELYFEDPFSKQLPLGIYYRFTR